MTRVLELAQGVERRQVGAELGRLAGWGEVLLPTGPEVAQELGGRNSSRSISSWLGIGDGSQPGGPPT